MVKVSEAIAEAVATESDARVASVDNVLSNIAPAYDPAQLYALGAFCIHEEKLYKCNTAIEEAEEWNQEHWTATTVMDEISTSQTL